MIDAFATSLTVRAIGWALLQSLWQGALVGAVTAVMLMTLRRSTASRRYLVACVSLIAIAAITMTTAVAHARELRARSLHHLDLVTQATSPTHDGRGNAAASETVSGGDTFDTRTTAASHWWSRERLEAWSVTAVPVWLIGVLLLSVRLVSSWLLVDRIRRAAVRSIPEAWQTRARDLASRLRVTPALRLVESDLVNVPMVIGCLRPIILLPGCALTGLSIQQLDAVIAHELAHVRRHDYLVNVLQTTIETLFFYHPVSWWISHQIRVERENCCDDVAVEACGDRLAYAGALADLEELRRGDAGFALAATGGPLVRRVRRVLGLSSTEEYLSPAWMVMGALITVFAFMLMGENVKSAQEPVTALPERSGETAADPRERLQRVMEAIQRTSTTKGVVRGHILDDRSNRPLANATVELSEGGRLASGATDGDGSYEVRDLEPGEYQLFVRADGYVPAEYGQRQPTEDGVRIVVRGGQVTSGVDIRLQQAGVIGGRIFADSGRGLSGVEVELIANRYLPGGFEPVAVGFAQTEADGAFRIADLRPGEYHVRAYVPAAVRPTQGDGRQVYLATYFPRVTRIEEAHAVLLSAGQEIFDVDFGLAVGATHVVSGSLVDPTGRPLGHASVVLMGLRSNTTHRQTVSSNGRFEIRNVVPGDYMLRVEDSRIPFGGPQLINTSP